MKGNVCEVGNQGFSPLYRGLLAMVSWIMLMGDGRAEDSTTELPLASVLPGFNWTTGGVAPWRGLLVPSAVSGGQAWSDLPAGGNQTDTSWLETTITGPGKVEWGAQTSYFTNFIEVSVDGKSQFSSTFGNGSQILPAGNHTVRWSHRRRPGVSSASSAGLYNVKLTAGTEGPLGDILGAPNLTFTTSAAAWHGLRLPTPYGTFSAAYSGTIGPGETSWLETTVTGPGVMSSVGSGASYAMPRTVEIDGVVTNYNGLNFTANLSPGNHTVRWVAERRANVFNESAESPGMLTAISWQPMTVVSFAEALDVTGINFTSSSPISSVYGRTSANAAGDDGVLMQNGGSLVGEVTGPGVLAWTGEGQMNLGLDGVYVNPWQNSIEIPPGLHRVKWTPNYDTARLYSVSFNPGTSIPLAEALGSGSLVWEVSPEVSAFSSEDGIVSIFVPQVGTGNRLYGLSTTLVGPGTFTLRIVNRSRLSNVSSLGIFLDGVLKSPNFATDYNLSGNTISIPSGTHTLRLSPTGANTDPAPASLILLQAAAWEPAQAVSLAEALDTTTMNFTAGTSWTGSPAGWEGVADGTRDYARASLAPPSGSNEGEAWLQTTVSGPGLLRFRASRRTNSESLSLLVNGVSTQVDYEQENFIEMAGAGTHVVRWIATLGQAASGEAALDAVSFTPYPAQPLSTWPAGNGFSLSGSAHGWAVVSGPDLDGGGSIHPVTADANGAYVEGVFTGPSALEFSMFTANSDGAISVSVDGGQRLLYEYLQSTDHGVWKKFRLHLPTGPHAVRISGPSYGTYGHTPLFWVDGLHLLASNGTLSSAGELPAGTTSTGPGPWLPFSDPALPDGDAVFSEGAFSAGTGSGAFLTIPVASPARVQFHWKGIYAPELSFGTVPIPVQFTAEADGWHLVSFDTLPGQSLVSIYPGSFEPVILDRWSSVAVPTRAINEIFTIPGATLTTNPDNPMLGYSPDNVTPAAAYGTTTDGIPGTWLEMTCAGPGLVRIHAETIQRTTMNPFGLTVDGRAFTSEKMASIIPRNALGNKAYAVSLAAGNHTLRFTLMPASFAKITALTFTPTPPLLTVPVGESGAVLLADDPPLILASEDGQATIQFPAGSTAYNQMVWQATSPGICKFQTHGSENTGGSASATGPAGFSAQLTTKRSAVFSGGYVSTLPLMETTLWTEQKIPAPEPQLEFSLQHSTAGVGMTMRALTFVLCESVSLTNAVNLPSIETTNSGSIPWSGLRDASGHTYVIPSTVDYGQFSQMEMTVTGPVELTWQETLSSYSPKVSFYDWDILNVSVVGQAMQAVPVSVSAEADLFGKRSMIYSLQVPPGPQVIHWSPSSGYSAHSYLENFQITPLSSAYLAWRPNRLGSPITFPLAPGGDADKDGQNNMMEFVYGTDPFVTNAPASLVINVEPTQITVCVPIPRPASDGVKVTIQTSTNLHDWTDAAVTPVTPAPTGQLKFRLTNVPASTRQLLVRTRVELVAP